MALEDAGGERCQWGPRGSLLTTHVDEWRDVRKDKDGYLYSNSIYASKYEAFAAARKYSALLPSGKTSGWYLPSVGQWVEIIEKLGQVLIKGYGGYFGVDKEEWKPKLAFLNLSDVFYWTSLQRDSLDSWCVSFNLNGCVYTTSCCMHYRVRSV